MRWLKIHHPELLVSKPDEASVAPVAVAPAPPVVVPEPKPVTETARPSSKEAEPVKAGVWDAMEQRKQLRSKLLSLSCWIRRFFLGTTQEFLKSKELSNGQIHVMDHSQPGTVSLPDPDNPIELRR